MKEINQFTGEYRWLSNFWKSTVTLDNLEYPTVEHAFQAAKTDDLERRQKIQSMPTPGDAKMLGRRVKLIDDWEKFKTNIMFGLLRQKFKIPELRKKLLATGDAKLVEGNTWGDTFWGVYKGKGRNALGKLLMQVRDECEREEKEKQLFDNLKTTLPELEELLEKTNGHCYEDGLYRFYHQSFKVYLLQDQALKITKVFEAIKPEGCDMNEWFMKIVQEGTAKKFDLDHNDDWLYHTRPIVEAFIHAKYFLEIACKYGKELEELPQILPSGWAAFLYLYGLR